MLRRAAGAVLIAVSVAGCSTLPPLEGPINPISISDVVDRVQCELWDAVRTYGSRPNYSWIKQWTAKFELTLQVDADAGLDPAVVFTSPYASGTFDLGLKAGISGKASRMATMTFEMKFAKLWSYPCKWPIATAGLNSNLGLKEWIGTVLSAIDKDDTVERADSFGQVVQFVVVLSGGVSPNFALERFKGPGDGLFSAKRTDDHKLNIAFAGPPPTGKKDVKGFRAVSPIDQRTLRERLDRTLLNQQLQSILPRVGR